MSFKMKTSKNVLSDLGDMQRYLWKHIWLKHKDIIEFELEKKQISISEDSAGSIYVMDQHDDVKAQVSQAFEKMSGDICATKHKLCCNLGSTQVDEIIQNVTNTLCSVFKDRYKDDILWVVSGKSIHEDMVKEIDEMAATLHSGKGPVSGHKGSFIYQAKLSQDEIAALWLFGLVDHECLKSPKIKLEKVKFDIKISAMEESVIAGVEETIRDILSKKSGVIKGLCEQKKPAEFEFMSRPEVHEYLLSKLGHRNIAWFYVTPCTIKVYGKDSLEAERNLLSLNNLMTIVPKLAPCGYFDDSQTRQTLKELERGYKGKVVINSNPDGKSLHLMYTDDNFGVCNKLQKLFPEKVLHISHKTRDLCKKIFQKTKESIEKRCNVRLRESTTSTQSYCWVVEGFEEHVLDAYKELKQIDDSVCSQTRHFIADGTSSTTKQKVAMLGECTNCLISVDYEKKAKSLSEEASIDVRETIRCRTWSTPHGSVLTLYLSLRKNNSWLVDGSTVVEVKPIRDSSPDTSLNFSNGSPYHVITLNLPQWKGGSNNEKHLMDERIRRLFKDNLQGYGRALSFSMDDATKINWPKEKYLKTVLASIQKISSSVIVHFYEACLDSARKLVAVIDLWNSGLANTTDNTSKSRLRIKVEKGELVKQSADVLVNSTSESLKLDSGVVSKSILSAAGPQIQEECKYWLGSHSRINYGEICVTRSYQLETCTYVCHGSLPYWNHNNRDEIKNIHFLKAFVWKCLEATDYNKLRSVALPALGTGNLGYPKDIVARAMFDIVEKFALEKPQSSVTDVSFIIYPKDAGTIKTFEEEEKKRRVEKNDGVASSVTNPDAISIKVTIVGKNSDVERHFKDLEKNLRKTDDDYSDYEIATTGADSHPGEPKIQTIQREPLSREEDNTVEAENNLKKNVDEDPESNSFLPKDEVTESTSPELTDEVVRLEVNIIDTKGIADPVKNLHESYNINLEQIVWNPNTPSRVRVKMRNITEARSLQLYLAKGNSYRATICKQEAVINIRAKLSKIVGILLEKEDIRQNLTKQSGANVECDNEGVFTLSGDLTEISEARSLLLLWQKSFTENRVEEIRPIDYKGKEIHSNSTTQQPMKDTDIIVSDTSKQDQRQVSDNDGKLTIKVFGENLEPEENNQTENKYSNHMETMETVSVGSKAPEDVGDDKIEFNYAMSEGYVRVGEEPWDDFNGSPKGFPVVNDDYLMKTTEEGIRVYVYHGNICAVSVDCIVNSSNYKMNHDKGRLSSVIAKEAGDEMKSQCKDFISNHSELKEGVVCPTSAGGNLQHYKKIFHVNAPYWTRSTSDTDFYNRLVVSVVSCLQKANDFKMKSIALPALGSGRGEVPKKLCYSAYTEGVSCFSKQIAKRTSTIETIHFVDVDIEVVQNIQCAFVDTIQEPKKKKRGSW